MRPALATSKSRRSRVGLGALIGIPASAAALAASQALAAPTQQPLHVSPRSAVRVGYTLHVSPRSAVRIGYGHHIVVRGTETAAEAGHTVVLEFVPHGRSYWRQLSATTIGASGQFRLIGAMTESGTVRAVDTSSGSLTPFVARGSSGGRLPARGRVPASSAVPVDVVAQVRVPNHQIAVLGGQAIRVRGRLLPARSGRKVSLQGRRSGRWQTLATDRTGSAGRFVLRYVAAGIGQESVRVRFAGDRLNGRSTADAGQITVFREAEASWYYDGGNTACGFHASYGVANRTLPCGTKVAFRYNGRSVTATVDDRGPYVGGRDWDLNQTTAGALGFGGVGIVWSSQ